jgi:cation diffusion facilitator CzcD-associated flavoprotein CzcO
MPPTPRHIAILGAGPIGIEAALAAAERGIGFTVYESGQAVAAHVRDWGHVRLFTPWSMNVSPRVRAALGGDAPAGDAALPAGAELAAMYERVAALPPLASKLRLGTRVEAVAREGLLKHQEIASAERAARPFRLLLTAPDGTERVERADAVIDCTGTYGNPNALGDGGIPAPGERALADRIERRIPDLEAERAAWAGRTVLLTGAGHSAQTAARALAELARSEPGTRVVWSVREESPSWGAVDADPLPERAGLNATAAALARGESDAVSLRRGYVVDALEPAAGGRVRALLRNGGPPEPVEVDRVLALHGGVGDFSLYRQLQVHECYATGSPMKLAAALLGAAGGDCLAQESHGAATLLNPEPGFFILGAKSYGRNSQFLLRIGWEQVNDVFGSLL